MLAGARACLQGKSRTSTGCWQSHWSKPHLVQDPVSCNEAAQLCEAGRQPQMALDELHAAPAQPSPHMSVSKAPQALQHK